MAVFEIYRSAMGALVADECFAAVAIFYVM
jgi:hypothetical protein